MHKAHISLINIAQACAEIRQACSEANAEDRSSPFVLVVGAGISSPYVPLSADIIEDCKTRARETGRFQQPSSLDPLAVYMHWLDRAYPQPQHRRRYLTGLLKDKSVSQANFRLAHLLLRENPEQQTLTDLVLSINFDDSLERALRIFSHPYVSCDHPHSAPSVDLHDAALKVVHLYGTYTHYDHGRLTDTHTRTRASTAAQANTAMQALVDNALKERAPIVVGYAGWENDLFMSALRRRLKDGMLDFNLYWFCYRADDFEALPAWLKDHSNVRFVLPQASLPEDEFSVADDVPEDPEAADYRQAAESAGVASNTLPARTVFEALIQEFDLPEPSLTRDPLAHVVARLRELLPDNLRNDPYDLNGIVSRLEGSGQAVEHPATIVHRSPSVPSTEPSAPQALATMRQAVRRAQWTTALAEGKAIALETLTGAQREQLADLFLKTAMGLFEEQPQRLAAFDAVIDLDCDELRDNAAFNVHLGKAYLYKGRTLGNINRVEDELATYEQALERFHDIEVQGLRDQLVRAIAKRLAEFGTVDANRMSENLIRTYGEYALPNLRRAVALALGERSRSQAQTVLRPRPPLPMSDAAASLLGNTTVSAPAAGTASAPPQPAAAVEPAKALSHDEKVAIASSDKAFEWLIHAKELWIKGNESGARHALANASRAVTVSLKRCPDRPNTLGNLAYIQFLNNQRETARMTLTKAISLGGDALRARILKDTWVHELPHDKPYRSLIESIRPVKPESVIPPRSATAPAAPAAATDATRSAPLAATARSR